MEPPVQAFEWARIFFGDEPPLFFLEIVFRTGVIYIYTLALLRWLGSRTIGQLSTIEFLLVIALGSAVGDAMFYPDVPLFHAMLVITVVVVANKGLDILIARFSRAERVIDGEPDEAIRNGVIPKEFVEAGTLSRSELFQQLREKGITHLGEVAHAYVETDGILTVFKADEAKSGLSIVPPWEIEEPQEFDPREQTGTGEAIACKKCGTLAQDTRHEEECNNCGNKIWVLAKTSTQFHH